MTNPPEEMARAYVFGHGEIWLWQSTREVYSKFPHDICFTPDYIARVDSYRPIPELAATNRDDSPEYVMAPEGLPEGRDLWLKMHGTEWEAKYQHVLDTGPDFEDRAKWVRAIYRPHPRHPEVLKRVWQRDCAHADCGECKACDEYARACAGGYSPACKHDHWIGGELLATSTSTLWTCTQCAAQPPHIAVPTAAVDWARVRAGKLVPPSRVVVPETNAGGSGPNAHGFDATGFVVSAAAWVCWTGNDWRRAVNASDAAHYSLQGQLLGYRTAEGWQSVAAEDPPPAPKPEREESTPAAVTERPPLPPELKVRLKKAQEAERALRKTEGDYKGELAPFDPHAYDQRKAAERAEVDRRVSFQVRDPEQDRLALERGERARAQDAVDAELLRRRRH